MIDSLFRERKEACTACFEASSGQAEEVLRFYNAIPMLCGGRNCSSSPYSYFGGSKIFLRPGGDFG